MIRPVRTHPDKILSRASAEVDERHRDSLAQVVEDLRDTMAALEERTGLRPAGLSAPQIGYALRVFLLAQWPHPFINPVLVIEAGAKVEYAQERCYSLPGVSVTVGRARLVRVRYETLEGEQRAAKMRDRDARAAQHEHDHLEGVTILQRCERPAVGDGVERMYDLRESSIIRPG